MNSVKASSGSALPSFSRQRWDCRACNCPRLLKQDPRGETERRPWLRRTPTCLATGGTRQRRHCISGLGTARLLRNVTDSADHLPPTSVPMTTRRSLPCSPEHSGYLFAFKLLATSKKLLRLSLLCLPALCRPVSLAKPLWCRWPAVRHSRAATRAPPLPTSSRPTG